MRNSRTAIRRICRWNARCKTEKKAPLCRGYLHSGAFHFLRLFQFVSPIFTVLAVEQLAEIIFFKHAEKVEHVGRCKIERGETGELRPPDLAPVGRAQRSGKLLRAIEQHDMTHAVFAPVLDPAQARRGDYQTCLLLNLTNDGICKGFTLFNMTARKSNAWPVESVRSCTKTLLPRRSTHIFISSTGSERFMYNTSFWV